MEKIGIFGGTFDPIHNGHINIVNYLIENKVVDRVIVIPNGKPPHKNSKVDDRLRLAMVREVFKDNDKVEVSTIEVEAKEKSYTYNTMKKLKGLYKDKVIYLIMGMDSYKGIKTWYNGEELLKEEKIIVFKRGDEKIAYDDINEVIYIENPLWDISSTEVRDKLSSGRKVEEITKEVEEIIKKDRLYKEVK